MTKRQYVHKTDEQVASLTEALNATPYMNQAECEELAVRIGLPLNSVKDWVKAKRKALSIKIPQMHRTTRPRTPRTKNFSVYRFSVNPQEPCSGGTEGYLTLEDPSEKLIRRLLSAPAGSAERTATLMCISECLSAEDMHQLHCQVSPPPQGYGSPFTDDSSSNQSSLASPLTSPIDPCFGYVESELIPDTFSCLASPDNITRFLEEE